MSFSQKQMKKIMHLQTEVWSKTPKLKRVLKKSKKLGDVAAGHNALTTTLKRKRNKFKKSCISPIQKH